MVVIGDSTMKKKIIGLLVVLFSAQQVCAWDWWWKKTQSINAKQLALQRKQIDDPANPYINFNAGVVAYKKQQFDMAAGSFERAIQYAPETKHEFKKQAHFNAGRTDYQRVLKTVGSGWEKEKLSDEVLDKAIELAEQSIKQFDSVLVLDGKHEVAKKKKEEAESLKYKLLAKKYQKNQQPQDKNKSDDTNKQQGGGEGQDQKSGGQPSKDGGQQGKDKKDADNKKDDQDKGDNAKGDQEKQGDDASDKKASDKSGKEDGDKKDKQDAAGKSDKQDDKKSDEQAGKQAGGDDQKDAPGKQGAGDKLDDKEGKEKGQGKGEKKDEQGQEETQGGAAGEEGPHESIAAQMLDAHSQALLDRAEQAAGDAQKRVMAYELMKMGKGGNAGGNQKPW